MKKGILIVVGVLVLVAVFGFSGFAYAQSQTPPGGGTPYGVRSGLGMMGRSGQGMMGAGGYGWMHEEMEQVLAARLGLTEEEVEEKLAAGESMWSIAQAQGLSDQEINDLMLAAREEALKAAVADGSMTQEQADWMTSRMQQMNAFNNGTGNCMGGYGQGAHQGPPMMRWNSRP